MYARTLADCCCGGGSCGVAGQNVSREHCAEDSARAVEADLAQLDTPYLDLLLLHFPPGGGQVVGRWWAGGGWGG